MWRIWHDYYLTSEATDYSKYQIFKPLNDINVNRVRFWVVGENNPSFTSIEAKFFSVQEINGIKQPVKELVSSTAPILKATITTLNNFAKEIYLDFPDTQFRNNVEYAFSLKINGYTQSGSSLLGWRKWYPDILYYTPTLNYCDVAKSEFAFMLVGYEL